MRRFSRAWLQHNLRHAQRRLDWRWRRTTSASRVLPDFLIIGTMKGGTTSLYDYLCQHPKVVSAYRKEVHYIDMHLDCGEDWYRAHFPTRTELGALGSGARTGEATPYYLFHPAAAEHLARMVPQASLIAVLRNPVDRAISHYHHSVRTGMESRPIAEAMAEESRVVPDETRRLQQSPAQSDRHRMWSYIARGHYAEQIRQYLKYFPREQLLVLRSEDLFQDPQSAVDKSTDYLGLPRMRLQQVDALNAGPYSKKLDPDMAELRKNLHEHFKPHNADLYELIGQDFDWREP